MCIHKYGCMRETEINEREKVGQMKKEGTREKYIEN